jgi:hypothetical protein
VRSILPTFSIPVAEETTAPVDAFPGDYERPTYDGFAE